MLVAVWCFWQKVQMLPSYCYHPSGRRRRLRVPRLRRPASEACARRALSRTASSRPPSLARPATSHEFRSGVIARATTANAAATGRRAGVPRDVAPRLPPRRPDPRGTPLGTPLGTPSSAPPSSAPTTREDPAAFVVVRFVPERDRDANQRLGAAVRAIASATSDAPPKARAPRGLATPARGEGRLGHQRLRPRWTRCRRPRRVKGGSLIPVDGTSSGGSMRVGQVADGGRAGVAPTSGKM